MDEMPNVVDYRARDALTDFLFDPVHLEWHLTKPFPDPSALHLLRNVLEKLYKNELRFRAAPLTQPAAKTLKSALHNGHEPATEGIDLRQELYHVRNWLFCAVKIVAELEWNPAVICGNNIVPVHLCLFLLDLLACYFRRQDSLDIDQFTQLNNVYDVGDFVANLLQSEQHNAGAPPVHLFTAQFCARCLLRLRINGACPPFFPKGTFVHVPGVTDAELALPNVGTTHVRQQPNGTSTAPFITSDAEDAKVLNIIERLVAHNVIQFMQTIEKRNDSDENEPMLIITRAALKLIPDSGSFQKVGSLLTATASNITWSACVQVESSYSTVRCLVALDFVDSLLLDAEFERARRLFTTTFTTQRFNSVADHFMPHIRKDVDTLNVTFSNKFPEIPDGKRLNADLLIKCPLICDCSNLPVTTSEAAETVPSISKLFSQLDARVAAILAMPTKNPITAESVPPTTNKSDAELFRRLVNTTDVNTFQQTFQKLSSSPPFPSLDYQKIISFIPLSLRASLEKELEKLVKKQHALLLLGKAFQCMHSARRDADVLKKAIEFFTLSLELCQVVLNESRRKVLRFYQTHAELQKFSLLINSASDPTTTIQQKTHTNRTLSGELVRWREDEKNITKNILATVVDRSLNANAVPPELFFACVLTTYNMQNFTYLGTIERTFPRDDFMQLISLLIKCERDFHAIFAEKRTSASTVGEKTALLAVPPSMARVNFACLWLTVYQAFGGSAVEVAEIRPLNGNVINVNVIEEVCLLTRSPSTVYILASCLAQLWTLTANARGFNSRGGMITQNVPNLWPNRVENAENVDFAALERIFSGMLERALSLHATFFNTMPLNSSPQPNCFLRELLQIQRDYFLAQANGNVEKTRACARTCMDLTQFYGTPGFADIFPACAPFPVAILRRLVLCCEELKYFTHVPLLAQYLFLCSPSSSSSEGGEEKPAAGGELEVDEQIVREMRVLAMRALQERSSYDACDELYEFFFDIDMLEMLIHYLFQRNELEKKLKAMRVIGNPTINTNNDPEFLMWERMKLLRRYLRLLKEEFQE